MSRLVKKCMDEFDKHNESGKKISSLDRYL